MGGWGTWVLGCVCHIVCLTIKNKNKFAIPKDTELH